MEYSHLMDLETEVINVESLTSQINTIANIMFNEHFDGREQSIDIKYSYEGTSQLMNIMLKLLLELEDTSNVLNKCFKTLWDDYKSGGKC